MEQELQNKIVELERRLREIESWKEEQISKDKIVVVGPFDGTNIPVFVNGIRRKIATVAP
jgi:hypothetical protein